MIRRELFVGIAGLALSGIVASVIAAENEGKESKSTENAKPEKKRGRRQRGQAAGEKNTALRLGIQTYTWHQLTFNESIDRAEKLGVHYLEGFSWQKIGKDTGDMELSPKASSEALEKTKQR